MAHELTIREDGQAEMMYTGEAPWHGLGTRLDNPATAEEAIAAAGLDWEIAMQPVYIYGADGTPIEVPNKYAITRTDSNQVFNVTSGTYKPVQNAEAFSFFDQVVGAGEAIYHTAGSLFGGKQVWILAKLPGDLKITDQDLMEKFILLTTGNDGEHALKMMLTPIRVVCNNTLKMALDNKMRQFAVRVMHTGTIMDRVAQARDVLGTTEAYFELMMNGINKMVDRKMQEGDFDHFTFQLFGLDETKAVNEQHPLHQKLIDTMRNAYHEAPGNQLPDVAGTRWAAYNAVTYYADHIWKTNRIKEVEENSAETIASKRLYESWHGRNGQLKEKAWNLLVPARSRKVTVAA